MSAFTSIIRSAAHNSVEGLLDAFSRAAATGNLQEYFGCFYDDRSRFLGTDASENWTAAAFFEYAAPHFKGDGTPAWKYDPIPGSRKIDIYPSAEAPLFATFDELLSSVSFGATSRGSGTACYSSGHWYICSYHLTFPIPNDLAKDITKAISKYETKKSLHAAAAVSDQHAAELLAELDMEKSSATEGGKKKTFSKPSKGKR
jgi:hypothetical protein